MASYPADSPGASWAYRLEPDPPAELTF